MRGATLTSRLSAWIGGHARAAELIDLRLDGNEKAPALAGEDAVWLDDHLAGCGPCRSLLEERALLRVQLAKLRVVSAPEGFLERVVLAAKTRPFEQPRARDPMTAPLRLGRQRYELAFGVGFVAILIVAVGALVAVDASNQGNRGELARPLSGGAALEISETPHLIVRAPGLGAAQIRSLATEIVHAHGGSYIDIEGALLARVPRGELVSVAQDLARRAPFRMTRVEHVELSRELETLVIRFELE